MAPKREIESKFALSEGKYQGKDILFCTAEVMEAIQQKGWALTSTNLESLHFIYYDTPQLDFYRQGATLRRITGYPPTSEPKAAYRYDYKTGALEERLESTVWSRWEWSPEKIAKKLIPEGKSGAEIQNQQEEKALQETARTDTFSLKLYCKRWFTQVEISLDTVSLVPEDFDKKKTTYLGTPEAKTFRELEIELLRGSEKRYEKLVHHLQEKLQLTAVTQQKYGRVMDMKRDK